MSCSGRKLMGPHSVGPQVCGKVRCSFSCLGLMSAAAARAPKASASPAPLHDHMLLWQTCGLLSEADSSGGCDTHRATHTQNPKQCATPLDRHMFRLEDLQSICACSIYGLFDVSQPISFKREQDLAQRFKGSFLLHK